MSTESKDTSKLHEAHTRVFRPGVDGPATTGPLMCVCSPTERDWNTIMRMCRNCGRPYYVGPVLK